MRPLEGITVVDLTQVYSGPVCTFHLSNLGADVIKVERPGTGDVGRRHNQNSVKGMSPGFVSVSAGKRSLALDLKTKLGRDVIHRLIGRADVLVENFRPGTAKRNGVGWEDCQVINPRLIYCSISGFGQSGSLSQWPAYDHSVQAMSGMMSLSGPPDGEPCKVGWALIDYHTGMVASSAILAALLQRHVRGKGQRIDVSMMDAALGLMTHPTVNHLVSGRPPARIGNRGGVDPAATMIQTGDGFLFIGANEQWQFEILSRIVGGDSLVDDVRFATHEARLAHAGDLEDELKRRLKSRPAQEWERLLMEAGCPAGAVRSIPEACKLPYIAERELFAEVSVPEYGRPVKVLKPAYRFLDDGPVVGREVPEVGRDNAAILAELDLPAVK